MPLLRLTMIIPSSARTATNTAAYDEFQDDPRGTTLGTFSVGLSTTGVLPATHYISCWGGLSATDFSRISSYIRSFTGSSVVVTPNDLSTPRGAERSPDQLMVSLGLQPISTGIA